MKNSRMKNFTRAGDGKLIFHFPWPKVRYTNQPRKPGFLSRFWRGKTLVIAGHVTLENPQNLGGN